MFVCVSTAGITTGNASSLAENSGSPPDHYHQLGHTHQAYRFAWNTQSPLA